MVDAFNTMFIKDESARFKAFLQSLPQDCIVLLAIQSSAYAKMPPTVLPLAELRSIGAQNAVNVTANGDSHAVIGYKGAQQPKWKDEHYAAKSLGPSEIAAMISIRCSYVPEGRYFGSAQSFYDFISARPHSTNRKHFSVCFCRVLQTGGDCSLIDESSF